MKILVSLVSLQHEHILYPWLRKIKFFQERGAEIWIYAGKIIKKLDYIGDVYSFSWLSEKEKQYLERDKNRTKLGFMIHSFRRNWLALFKFPILTRNENFDLIYTPSSVLDLVIFPWWQKISGRKIFWMTIVGNVVPLRDKGNKLIRFLAWIFFKISLWMIKKADYILTETPEVKEYLIRLGFDSDKLIFSGLAVENEMIEKAHPSSNQKFDALFCGRINETKGIYDMLNVLEVVKKEYPQFKLAIMGEGDLGTLKKFKKEMSQKKLKKNIIFLGYKSGMEKYNLIKSSKSFWFLSSSASESFGVALLEAVCSGVPAFAYNLPQFSWLYSKGEVNISQIGDWKNVAREILALFKKGDFTNEKGKKILRKYDWNKIAQIEYKYIKKLL